MTPLCEFTPATGPDIRRVVTPGLLLMYDDRHPKFIFAKVRIFRDPFEDTGRHRGMAGVLDARKRWRLATRTRRDGRTRATARRYRHDDALAESNHRIGAILRL